MPRGPGQLRRRYDPLTAEAKLREIHAAARKAGKRVDLRVIHKRSRFAADASYVLSTGTGYSAFGHTASETIDIAWRYFYGF